MCNAGDSDLIPGSGRSRGKGNGDPLQYSCLENSMDKEAWVLQSMGSQRAEHNLVTCFHLFSCHCIRRPPWSTVRYNMKLSTKLASALKRHVPGWPQLWKLLLMSNKISLLKLMISERDKILHQWNGICYFSDDWEKKKKKTTIIFLALMLREKKQIFPSEIIYYICILTYLQYKYTGKILTLSNSRIKMYCMSATH